MCLFPHLRQCEVNEHIYVFCLTIVKLTCRRMKKLTTDGDERRDGNKARFLIFHIQE